MRAGKREREFSALRIIRMYICMHYEYMYKKLSNKWFGLKLKEIGYRYFGMFDINILFVYSKKKSVQPFIDSHRSAYLRGSTENDYGNLQIGFFFICMC